MVLLLHHAALVVPLPGPGAVAVVAAPMVVIISALGFPRGCPRGGGGGASGSTLAAAPDPARDEGVGVCSREAPGGPTCAITAVRRGAITRASAAPPAPQ